MSKNPLEKFSLRFQDASNMENVFHFQILQMGTHKKRGKNVRSCNII